MEVARQNLEDFKVGKSPIKSPIEIIHMDASRYKITDENIFYMFNPFGDETFVAAIENIKNSFLANPRHMRIIYFCPRFAEVLDRQDWLVREYKIDDVGNSCVFWSTKDVDAAVEK